jgi:hypothetical protein
LVKNVGFCYDGGILPSGLIKPPNTISAEAVVTQTLVPT